MHSNDPLAPKAGSLLYSVSEDGRGGVIINTFVVIHESSAVFVLPVKDPPRHKEGIVLTPYDSEQHFRSRDTACKKTVAKMGEKVKGLEVLMRKVLEIAESEKEAKKE